jgi:hypothetical protein
MTAFLCGFHQNRRCSFGIAVQQASSTSPYVTKISDGIPGHVLLQSARRSEPFKRLNRNQYLAGFCIGHDFPWMAKSGRSELGSSRLTCGTAGRRKSNGFHYRERDSPKRGIFYRWLQMVGYGAG